MANSQHEATPAEVSDTLSVADLTALCDQARRAIAAEGGSAASADELKPGSTANPDGSVRGWLTWFRHLHRMHALLTRDGAAGPRGAPSHEAAVHAAITDSLAEKRIAVQCLDGVTRHVHPKGLVALAFITSLDRQHQLDMEAATISAQLLTKEDVQVYALAPIVNSLARQIWLWILTSPGAGLPFDAKTDVRRLKIPEWIGRVTPEDIVRFFEAHLQLHQGRLGLMATAFPSEGRGESRLPLSGFIGVLAHETGQDARELMHNHSLGKLFAQSVSAAESARAARARAEANALNST